MKKPTEEEYGKAVSNVEFFNTNITYSRNEIDDLLDRLCVVRDRVKTYEGELNKNKEIIMLYKIYKECEKENGE